MKRPIVILCFLVLIISSFVSAQQSAMIEYHGKTPEGLVGNGRSVVKVRPSGFEFHSGGDAGGVFHLIVDGKTHELTSPDAHAVFFPGGVRYYLTVAGLNVDILHGATEGNAYVVGVRVKGKKKNIELEIQQHGTPILSLSGRIPFLMKNDTGEQLWEGFFTASEIKISGLSKSLLTPFPAPDPVTLNGKTYVVNKVKNILTCYDANTGAKIWDSEKFPDAQKIPTLYVSDGLIIMGYGGDELKCASITQTSGPTINRYEYNNKDKYGISAYDATTGKIVWSNETIEKAAKDKFNFIAGLKLIDGKLFCATDKNFFILEPKTGNILKSAPVAKEKLGDAWKMYYFENEKKIILNCDDGIVKLDPVAMKVEGTLKTPNVPFYQASKFMNADDTYQDFAIFTSGDAVKMKFKEFASIDLDKMTIRGMEDGDLLFHNVSRFSEGGEMFYKADDEVFKLYSVK